jgi:tetratricopeptide (TPR) repeat protein
LRNILKTRLLLFIQGFYAGQNKEAELEALSDTINNTIQAIHEKEPTYLIGGKLLVAATKTRAEYFFRLEQNDKVLKYAGEGIRTIQDQYYSNDYFYTLEGLGELHLLLARVHERNKAWTLVEAHASQSQAFFDQAIGLIEERLPETQWRLIGNLGHSHMLQGQVRLENRAYTEADQEFQKALDYFERALEINPQAASAISQRRNELVKITHDHPEVSAVAPTDGWWFEAN